MEYKVQLKLRGDAHGGGFSNGLTLAGSQSVADLELVSASDDLTVYANPHGHRIECWHVARPDGTVECRTVFENRGYAPATLDLLTRSRWTGSTPTAFTGSRRSGALKAGCSARIWSIWTWSSRGASSACA